MSNTWSKTVPLVVDGKTKFNAADMNNIIGALVNRTDYLKNIINTIQDKNGYTITDIGFTGECEKGTIVCYNAKEGKYYPAAALWDTDSAATDNMKPSYRAYIKGVVISDRADDTSATILCEGWLTDPAVINRMVGINAVAGDYYLQADGSISTVMDEKVPVVFCCTYTTSKRMFISPSAPEIYGHAHSNVTVYGRHFEQVTQSHPLYTQGLDASYAYDTTSNEALSSLLTAAGDRAILIGNGTVMNTGTWGFYDGYLYTKFPIAETDIFTLYGITPIMGDTSIVRGIRIDRNNKILTADTYNNTVYLNTVFDAVDTKDMTGTCVTAIDNNGVRVGPVVQELTATAGIAITRNTASGSYSIGLTSVLDTLLDMQLVNINGAIISESDSSIYITFPAKVSGSVVGGVRIPASGVSNLIATPVLLVAGNGGALPSFNIQTTVYKLPEKHGDYTAISNTRVFDTAGISNTNRNLIYRVEPSNAALDVSDNAYISIKVSAEPQAAVSVLTIGFYIKHKK